MSAGPKGRKPCPMHGQSTAELYSLACLVLMQIVFVPQFDIRDDALVRKAISRSNVVINLIGQRTETMNYKYEEVHADWPKKLATCVPSIKPSVQDYFMLWEVESLYVVPLHGATPI